MGFITPTFKDITMKTEHLECHIGLAKYGWRFKRAQEWLETTIMGKMAPVVPYRTGQFLGKLYAANAGRYGDGELRVSVPPQGRKLYEGVNPATGRPYRWTNPLTQPRWASYTIKAYEPELKAGVRRIIFKGEP